jgi:hypothetical protein
MVTACKTAACSSSFLQRHSHEIERDRTISKQDNDEDKEIRAMACLEWASGGAQHRLLFFCS